MKRSEMKRITALTLIIAVLFSLIPSGQGVLAEEGSFVRKFDFGTASSPVKEGFRQVHDSLLYSAERGYGLDRPTASRNRSGGDELTNDFVLAYEYQFLVDVPNGEYDVTVYSGDLLAGTSTTRTNIALEGAAAGSVTARQSVSQATFRTAVSDGQLTVGITGSGAGGYLNGLVVEEVLPEPPEAPATLAVTGVKTYPVPEVSLQWGSVTDAVYYQVYRSSTDAGSFGMLAQVQGTAYTDSAVSLGNSYAYQVTAVNVLGLESVPSPTATAAVVGATEPPAAPENPLISDVSADAVTLRWTEAEGAVAYAVFRADTSDGSYEEIGRTAAPEFVDANADTTKVNYYVVKALNEAGLSEASNVARASPYVPAQPLPEGFPLKLDFGPGQVAEGYFGVRGDAAYSAALKYGFANPASVGSADRGTTDALKSDFVSPAGTAFMIDLPNGDYSVSVVSGDAAEASEIRVVAESITKIPAKALAAGEYLEQSFDIALVDGQLTLELLGAAPKLNALTITKLPVRSTGEIPTVYIAGDSTVQTYDPYWKPEAGWGQMIDRYFTEAVAFDNHAIGGRSSKSFIVEGRLDAILREIRPNDYFLIQFGHNDATVSVPERYASVPDYKNYLKTYVNGARQRGATPILATPVGRRDYNAETGLFRISFPEYVQGMKEVAQELNVPIVDLSALSVAYYDSIGPAGTLSVFLHVEPGVYQAFPNGSADNTHFQEYGAIQIARLLSGGIKELGLPLSLQVKNVEPPADVPGKPTGVIAGNVSNAGAALTWNEVEDADIYKVYRKLSTDDNYALVATSTIPAVSITGMEDGKTYHVRISAVNGKGESEWSDVVVINTKQATYRFDFGLATSPVAEGYTGVNLSTVYTPERGYGIVDPGGMIGRDRGSAGSDLARDWLGYFNTGWRFNVDAANGLYSAKVYVGDLLGSARTNLSIEGQDYGTITAARNSVTDKVIPVVSVKDGQLNFYFGGQTGIANGLELTPILLAPSELQVDGRSFDPDRPSVSLSWKAVDEAVRYRIYRKASGTAKPELAGSSESNSFTDAGVDLGMSYEYTVTTVDQAGTETVPSMPLPVAMVDPSAPAPAAPTRLALGAVNKNDVTFSWGASESALTYNVYRAEKPSEAYEFVGKTRTTSFTDAAVLTTIPYYYKVAAANAGGISALSEALATPAVTVLHRQAEHLDRSPVAIRTEQGVYVGWRMLGSDPEDIAFNVYRDGVKVNAAPITTSTNLTDAEGTADSEYQVFAVAGGREKAATKPFGVWQQNYLSVPLQKPADGVTKDNQPYTYAAGDASVGDLDGDGAYEIVMLWNPSNAKDNSQAGYTGIVYMDAYKLDGTRLWRINLGPNIRAGAHYTQFMVYDLDGDGRAEVAFKTADGTVDGQGGVIGRADADHRNSSGYILQGEEYLTVFEGATGKALDTVPYDPPRGDVGAWGDGYGNRVDRFLAAVAYLDGERPSLIFSRGYYTRTVIAAYHFRDGELTKLWTFDTNEEGNGGYAGQGNHNLSIGDVDGDGKDEISFGAMAVDDDGTGLYTTGLGHGDAMHLGDFDPARTGLELFDVHEHTNAAYGMELRDPESGEVLWGIRTGMDTGRGMAADLDPNHLGAEFWSATIINEQHIQITGLHNAKGEMISENIPSSTNFGVWWDADLLRELQDYNRIDKWDWETETTANLLTAVGASSNNGTKANSSLQADLFGDWREEVMWRSGDSTEYRIYSTTEATEHRIRTLMHDPIYRLSVAWQNVGYNQPPHTSFYLGEGMSAPPAPRLVLTEKLAPVTTHTVEGEGRNGWYRTPVTVTLTADDEGAGVSRTYYRLNGGAAAEGNSVAIADEGEHSLTYWSDDKSGNTEEPRSASVKIDLTAPAVTFSVEDGSVFGIDRTVVVGCAAEDALSGIASSDCQDVTVDAYELGVGTHTFAATAEDFAGNVSSKSITIEVTSDYDSLSALVARFVGHEDVRRALIEKLNQAKASDAAGNAKAKQGQLEAFANQLHAQSGKALTERQAQVLLAFAGML